MRKPVGVVLDTNVFISAFILKKASYKLAEAWQDEKFFWILSPEIKEEYFAVISRPKFGQNEYEVRTIRLLLEHLIEEGTIKQVTPAIKLNIIKEDPKDNKFLEGAVSANASYIVSGDRHLLNQKQYRDILILSIRDFLQKI
ncbi:MAG: putative toxin-antitoxin system toxin component, PIN family [Candidatus Omnitrophica bacterium]|nr:putative toxin-antitoxin system toxin component, PIN family [Candidatus Omnitrophota bacterium]